MSRTAVAIQGQPIHQIGGRITYQLYINCLLKKLSEKVLPMENCTYQLDVYQLKKYIYRMESDLHPFLRPSCVKDGQRPP